MTAIWQFHSFLSVSNGWWYYSDLMWLIIFNSITFSVQINWKLLSLTHSIWFIHVWAIQIICYIKNNSKLPSLKLFCVFFWSLFDYRVIKNSNKSDCVCLSFVCDCIFHQIKFIFRYVVLLWSNQVKHWK